MELAASVNEATDAFSDEDRSSFLQALHAA
jgi:hypothetical protein